MYECQIFVTYKYVDYMCNVFLSTYTVMYVSDVIPLVNRWTCICTPCGMAACIPVAGTMLELYAVLSRTAFF